jgi:hypothetical protein
MKKAWEAAGSALVPEAFFGYIIFLHDSKWGFI